MMKQDVTERQVCFVSNFKDLLSVPFRGTVNAACWRRELKGDFSEIILKSNQNGNIVELHEEDLLDLHLSGEGQLARTILIEDLQLLRAYGASPVLNVITYYERDEGFPFFPTDVYSFHADRSPIAVDTFLCTYYGDASEILPNSQAEKKVHVPEIRKELRKLHAGPEKDFETFLSENSFDLHYRATPGANPINLGVGHLWRLAVEHPGSLVAPCIHRAPKENAGTPRLLMIC